MAGGWDRASVEGIPQAALEGAFERLRNRFVEMLTPLSDDEFAVRMAAMALAARVVAAGAARLWFGAARVDDDTPAAAVKELWSLARAMRRVLKAKDGLSMRAAGIASLAGQAHRVVAMDWAHFERVTRVYEEAAVAAQPMKAIGPNFLLDRLAEVYVELTRRQPPIVGSQRGAYYRIAQVMLDEVGMKASIVDHARGWILKQK